jgi:hypothetical protein
MKGRSGRCLLLYGSSRDLVTVATFADQMQAPDDASPDWSRRKCCAWRGDLLCHQRVGRSCVGIRRGLLRRHDLRDRPVCRCPPRSLPRCGPRCVCVHVRAWLRVRARVRVWACWCGLEGACVHACDCARVHTRVQGRGAVALRLASKGPAQYLRKSGNRGRLSRPFQTHRATVQHERFHVVCCMLRRPRACCMPRIACCQLQVACRCCSSAAHCIVVYAHLSSCAKGTSKILRHNFATFAGSSCDTCRFTAT